MFFLVGESFLLLHGVLDPFTFLLLNEISVSLKENSFEVHKLASRILLLTKCAIVTFVMFSHSLTV